MLAPNEIVYCNINAGKYSAEKVTLTADAYGNYQTLKSSIIEHSIILKKMNCKEKEVKITELEIIHKCGVRNI